MINYSIATKAVNSNLLEINQAKARVTKAKEENKQPDEADVKLANTKLITKAYAVAQYADVMNIEKFAKYIANHGCVYSRADISAILYMAVDCMREQMLEGKKIRLGDLGDFSISLVSKGAESAEKFNPAIHITSINVVWDCGSEFNNLLADAEFNLVASRAAQAKVIKAIKAGEMVVDLNASKGDDNDDDDDNTPTPTVKYTLTVKANNDAYGTVEGSGLYDENASAIIKAIANSGYEFKQWNDGNTTATRSVTVVADTFS